MKTKKQEQQIKHRVAPQVTAKAELHKYEESFRRWLGHEIHSGRMTVKRKSIKGKVLPYNFDTSGKEFQLPYFFRTFQKQNPTVDKLATVQTLERRISNRDKLLRFEVMTKSEFTIL